MTGVLALVSTRYLAWYVWGVGVFWAMGHFFDPVTYPIIALGTLVFALGAPLPYGQWVANARDQVAREEAGREAELAEMKEAAEREADPSPEVPDDLSGLDDEPSREDD